MVVQAEGWTREFSVFIYRKAEDAGLTAWGRNALQVHGKCEWQRG